MNPEPALLVASSLVSTTSAVLRPLRVAVLSKNRVTRAGLRQMLSECGEHFSVLENAVETARLRDHDVVLFDVSEVSDLIGSLRHDLSVLLAGQVSVVALTPRGCPDLEESVIAMGATSTVSMDVTVTALAQAVERAAAGEATDLAAYRRARRVAASRARAGSQLSARELTILELVGTGLTNRDIADRLYLSINSVKTYIRTAYRKIGVSRRAEAVLWVVHREQTASHVSIA